MHYSNLNGENPILIYRNGIKLIDTETKLIKLRGAHRPLILNQLLNLAHCIYFSDTTSKTAIINTTALEKCGYILMQEAIGKTIRSVATRETSNRVINMHQQVMNTHRLHITLDEVELKHAESFTCMSILRPWYDKHDKLLGIFGCSVDLKHIDITKSLSSFPLKFFRVAVFIIMLPSQVFHVDQQVRYQY